MGMCSMIGKTVAAAALFVFPCGAQGADQMVYNVCDIAQLEVLEDTTQLYFNSRTLDEAFTLSADTTIPAKVGVSNGPTCFDFSDGNHRLSVTNLWVTMNRGTEVRFKGGTWDFQSTGAFYHGCYGGGSYESQKMVLDSVDILNVNGLNFGGNNATVILTNNAFIGTSSSVSTYLAYSVSQSEMIATNMNMVISAGSKIHSHSTIYTDAYYSLPDGTDEAAAYAGNRILVTGEGSYLGPTPGRSERLYHGNCTGGNVLRYEKGATAKFYETFVGVKGNAKGNVLVIADGAAFTNTNAGAIGTDSGANSNRVEVLSGGEFCQSQNHAFSVGKKGCHNVFYVSNAVVANAKALIAGQEPGAMSNKVHVTGQDSGVSFYGEFPTLFGCGRHNEWMLENCNIDGKGNPLPGQNAKDWRLYFSGTALSPTNSASTNNCLKLLDSARLRVYEFYFPVASKDNLAVVANCCTLEVSNAFSVRGCGNTVSLSDGLLKINTLTFGSAADDDSGFEENGNVLEFCGRTPLLTQWAEGVPGTLKFYDSGVIRFCVPEEGYPTSSPCMIHNVNTYMYGGTLEFEGVEKLTRSMTERELTYELTNQGFRVYDTEGNENPASFFEEVTATLPPGCSVYVDSGLLHLYLKVRRAPKGTAIVIR